MMILCLTFEIMNLFPLSPLSPLSPGIMFYLEDVRQESSERSLGPHY